MIVVPEGYAAIKGFPGYFWNLAEERLYSMKVDGVLKPLKKQKGFARSWKPIPPHYAVSKGGYKRMLTDWWIKERLVFNGEIPVKKG